VVDAAAIDAAHSAADAQLRGHLHRPANRNRDMSSVFHSGIRTALFVVIASVAVYLAAGAWTTADLHAALKENKSSGSSTPVIYDEITFVNESAMKKYAAAQQAGSWFPYIIDLPQSLSLMLAALAFGAVGGTIRAAYDCVAGNALLTSRAYAIQGLGALTGIVILAFSYIVPTVFAESETVVRPIALLFFCILGGMFYDQIFAWAKLRITTLLQEKKHET
jgi:hypothetical protein